ncbi:MAG TPA: hypothetical protein VJT54_09425 [Verrucomicrobiae bacterium]|nr:hypothetical protein [Verrucomicrobiae bacterium]
MKSKLLLYVALVLSGGLSASEAQTNSQPQEPTCIWEHIDYPWPGAPDFMVSSGEQWKQASFGLRLDIMNIVQGIRFFKTNAITAKLYRANGEVVEPTAEGRKLLNAPVIISAASLPNAEPAPQVMTYFPWGSNTLEEAWIEVTIGPERYWLEIPYGFDRNPTEPLPSSVPGGPPKFIPPMKLLTGYDHVVRWQNVHYDLGQIQNGWRLSLIQSNSGEAESQVVLYREDVKIGTSTSWKIDSPATVLRVLDASGTTIGSHCTDVHIQDGGMERSSEYVIARNGGALRCWGQIEISVDDKSYRVVVPSSLYKYNHGHTPQQIGKIDFKQP